jgi:hypothetical protein
MLEPMKCIAKSTLLLLSYKKPREALVAAAHYGNQLIFRNFMV